jgi:hypothetical protein
MIKVSWNILERSQEDAHSSQLVVVISEGIRNVLITWPQIPRVAV